MRRDKDVCAIPVPEVQISIPLVWVRHRDRSQARDTLPEVQRINEVARRVAAPRACHMLSSHAREGAQGPHMALGNQYRSDLIEQREIAEKLMTRGLVTAAEIANHFGLSRQTVAVWARGIDVSL